MDEDLYAVLGVAPEADIVVIRAAYRALAAKYHPDHAGDGNAEAAAIMQAVNRAHEVLGDPAARAQYDAHRSRRGSFSESQEQKEAFEEALCAQEERWQVACSVFPDLAALRTRLAKTSYQLAFSFVVALLETKQFQAAAALADSLERRFLQRYFGTNERVLRFARELIRLGKRDAVKALNRLVDILGSEVDPQPIITKISKDFGIDAVVAASTLAAERRREIETAQKELIAYPCELRAKVLADLLQYEVTQTGGGFFRDPEYRVRSPDPDQPEITLRNTAAFVGWAVHHLGHSLAYSMPPRG